MSRTLSYPKHHTGCCRPRVERLEARLALSMSAAPDPIHSTISVLSVSAFDVTSGFSASQTLTAALTDPAPGTSLTGSPGTLTVTFNSPISFDLLAQTGDIVVQREQSDGSWALAYDPTTPPTETTDASGTQLILTLATPLNSGHYRLVIPESNVPLFLGTTGPFGGATLADTGNDQVLGDFTIANPGVSLKDAIVTAPLGPDPIVINGNLDLSADPGAVLLYKLEVPKGHHWRFGAEVDAQLNGSPLRSALSLFDANGHLLETAVQGRPDAPADPYMFVGLNPGTYYLGLSGAGNLPGLGGYDPSTGARGNTQPNQTGGSFRLTLLADRADAPTRLLGFSLNHADPLDSAPTGFTLSFSGLLDTETLQGATSAGLTLIGPDGLPVGITTVGLNEANARYVFLFDQALAPGHYTLQVPSKGGVTDLAGLTPIARGKKDGVLASFDVAKPAGATLFPNNLGPLYIGDKSGLGAQTTVAPGTAVTYRFVAEVEGNYSFSSQTSDPSAAGGITTQLLGSGGVLTLDSTSAQRFLKPGVYAVSFINHGDRSVLLSFVIKQHTSFELLLNNGVGQGPALNLRLVNPTSSPLSAATDQAGQGPQAISAPASSGAGGPAGPSGGTSFGQAGARVAGPGFSSLTPGGTALTFTIGQPVGRPTSDSEHVTVATSGGTALVSSEAGLLQGIAYSSSTTGNRRGAVRTEGQDVSSPSPADVVPAGPALEPLDGTMVATHAKTESLSDELVIAAADWITRLGTEASRMLGDRSDPAPELVANETEAFGSVKPIAMRHDGDLRDEGRVERASFETPLLVGMASLMAARFHQPFRRWIERRRGTPASRKSVSIFSTPRGPHWKI
jgi:methionine-rich copper-binding protein CopC